MDSSTSTQHNTRMQQTQGQQGQEENNNDNYITLDLRVSCNTFWKYEMKLSINRDDYVEPNENDIVNGGGGGADTSGSYFNSDNKKTRTFSRLERFMCDAMIAHIHEDLALNGQEELIEKLCDISSKFHVHGHTTRSLLYHQSNAPHADHGGCIYICTHC